MQDFAWSPGEKKIARTAFDLALRREMESVRRKVESMLARSSDPFEVWRVHDYLSKKRREIDQKYDYRYSQLPLVFARLVSQGWIKEDDLHGLRADKLDFVKRVLSLGQS